MTTPDDRSASHPRTFGEELKRRRVAAGLSLEDIAHETKISRRVLDALESGSFGQLPERVFSRSFVGQISRLIGADEAELLGAFDAAWERFLLTSGSHPALAVVEPPPARTVRLGYWIPLVLAVAVLAAVVLVIVRGWSRPERTLPPDPRRSVATRPTPTSTAGRLLPTAPPVESQPTAPPAVAAQQVAIGIAVESGRECWVYYRDHDGRTDQQLLVGGAHLELTLAGPVKLTLGNAGAATVTTGGREYDDLGGYGQVVHAHVGADGLRRLRGGDLDGG